MQDGSRSFSWILDDSDTPNILTLFGELDLPATLGARETLIEELERTDGPVTVDATALDFIDSTGLALLFEVKRMLDREGRSFTIGAVSPTVDRVLSVSGVWHLFAGARTTRCDARDLQASADQQLFPTARSAP